MPNPPFEHDDDDDDDLMFLQQLCGGSRSAEK
jgi:hypothetical protein